MTEFEQAYKALNEGQRRAVDTIEGPVLVVAGPGTGKTQLLGMRAAHILRRTDAAPSNILCLTFTESAALEMRQRLISLMGQEGNRVAVHTFHSFGAEVINSHPEHFYNGARFAPAEELTGYEILRGIFEELPHSSPLAKTMNDEFTALKDARSAISHLKRAGLQPDELADILDHNQGFCNAIEPLAARAFAERLSAKKLQPIRELLTQATDLELPAQQTFNYKSLRDVFVYSLTTALEETESLNKTTPLTKWRTAWCEKDGQGKLVLKDQKRIKKLRALVPIYQKYGEALSQQELFDFDDMVTLVAHTLEKTDDLRLTLQEQYQYVMVDEFQDTNGAQLRLLAALTENPVNEGRPNVLAVGDDDQAIYAFQGAELSNILEFAARYRNPEIIALTDNYRSTASILQHSRHIITQADQRLEAMLTNIRKELTAHNTKTTAPALHQFASVEAEYHWVAEEVQRHIKQGVSPNDIAIIARHHKQLVQLVPYLHAAGLAVTYERRNNVLDNQHIRELITLAEVVAYLGEQRYDLVEELLPELLSYEFWGLKTDELWKLSLSAYKQRRMWLELMVEAGGSLHAIAEFLIIVAHQALHEPCEVTLDKLLGSTEQQVPNDDLTDNGQPLKPAAEEDFVSPYRAFYFNRPRLGADPLSYLTLLSNLRALRQAAANYRPRTALKLHDFIDFIELCERTNTSVVDAAITQEAAQGVHLMTAHKAKGLEFDTVFVLSCQDEIWGRKSRRPSSSLSFPANLPIEPAGNHYDDAVRLFFVAMTRAKHHLHMTCHQQTETGKESIVAEFLQTEDLQPIPHPDERGPTVEELAPGWHARHLTLPKTKQEILLRPQLQNYRLSATHINNFVDVTRGGPQAFLLQNLLRFPQAMSPAQIFGHAVHHVLARAHTHLDATGERRPVEDVLHDLEIHLQNGRLSERDFGFWLEKGSDVLQAYLKERYSTFKEGQKAERDFAGQESVVDGVRLSGIIDLMTIDQKTKTVVITDYKTGKPFGTWRGATDYDKIKLHKYKQQLMFYKLLVEHSRDFSGYGVQKGELAFVEADTQGQLHQLELEYTDVELTTFRKLLQAVWQRIMQLDFADTSTYDPSFKGIVAFENHLITQANEQQD